MKTDFLGRLGAMSAAGAILLGAGSASAAVYDFALSGVVADGAYSSFGDLTFYDLLLTVEGDFEPPELQVGDVLNFTLTLDQFLNVPSAPGTTFFGIDVLTGGSQLGTPPGDGTTSSGSISPIDGTFAGNTYFSACSNCIAATGIFTPGPQFDISQLTASVTIEGLVNFDPDDMSPIFATDFRLRYQSDQGATAAVPEPATWAMMILGFGAAGSVIRRRRRVVGLA